MKYSLFAQKINTFILDTLFPVHCLSCGKEGEWVCSQCLGNVSLLDFQICPKCEIQITQGGITCPKCKENYPLDALVTVARYKEHDMEKIIHAYKYQSAREIAPILGLLMTKVYLKQTLPIPDIILPVPLHPRRLRWRGFNQSSLLGQHLGLNLTVGMPVPFYTNILLRTRYTSPQMKIKNYHKRKENMINAFSIKPNADIKDKKILLVDDVATTGATLLECAKVLKQNGAKKVYAIVIARQEIK